MFGAAFRALGLDWSYRAVPVPPGRAGEALAGLARAGAVGVNVTMPLKQEVLAHAGLVTARARLVGAANTLTLVGGGWEADNTDWPGLGRALAGVVDLPGRAGRVGLVFGAGGAAAAAAFCLKEAGLEVVLVNRNPSRGRELARRVGGRYLPWGEAALPGVLAQAAVVINATPLGMGDLEGQSPLPEGVTLSPDCVACDLVYRPVETEFLRRARALGARVVTGLEVLLWQGVLALERWTGREAPVEVMRRALAGAAEGGREACVT
jgi:shikimate dehydrogenase